MIESTALISIVIAVGGGAFKFLLDRQKECDDFKKTTTIKLQNVSFILAEDQNINKETLEKIKLEII